MRVLHVYAGNLYGGIETLLATLARQRALCPGMEPQFALCFEGRLSEELRESGAPVHMLGPARVSRPWTILRARHRLRRLIESQAIETVVCHACWPHALFAPTIRKTGATLVFWCHDIPRGRHWLERWAARQPPDLAIANSRQTHRALPALFPSAPRAVFYSPVPAPEIAEREQNRRTVRQSLNTPQTAVVIVMACRLEPWKGHELLLDALARIQKASSWHCWITGRAQRPTEAAYLQKLRERVERQGLDERIHFPGHCEDLSRILAAADIHCQPNTAPESLGIAFVEALYAGLPVVTTAIGGALEIVDDSCGILVPPGDVNALAEALHRLIDDAPLRTALGNAGPARARSLCDLETQLTALGKLLASAKLQGCPV